MDFRPIGAAALTEIYRAHMVHDFPESELKPLPMLLKGLKNGTIHAYALYDGDEVAAYATLLSIRPGDACILDYLATVESRRGTGAGSEMLQKLRVGTTGHAGLLIEYECPHDAPDEAETQIRLRRERFYLNNGMRKTAIDLDLFGVHYSMGYLPCVRDLDDQTLTRMQKDIYDAVNCWDYHFRPLPAEGGE